MIHMLPELREQVLATELCLSAIALLKRLSIPTTKELRQLPEMKARLLILCPPGRYAWRDGLPVCDILKTLHNQNEMEV